MKLSIIEDTEFNKCARTLINKELINRKCNIEIMDNISHHVLCYNDDGDLVGYFQANIYENVIEIYSICRFTLDRIDFIKNYIYSFVKNSYDEGYILWIGLGVDHPEFRKILELYISIGFRDPKLDNKSLSGRNFENFYFISFTYSPENLYDVERIDYTILQSIKLRKEYYVTRKLNNVNININYCMDVMFNVYSDYTDELGVGFTIDYNGNELYEDAIIFENEDLCTVRIPPSLFGFHTHPKKCYIIDNCIFGWPSDIDYKAFIRNNWHMNFVASVEGIYVVQIPSHVRQLEFTDGDIDSILEEIKVKKGKCSPREFKNRYTDSIRNDDWKNIINIFRRYIGENNQTFNQIFQGKNFHNLITTQSDHYLKNIHDYVECVNNFTYNNTRIFYMQFKSWVQILQENGLNVINYRY